MTINTQNTSLEEALSFSEADLQVNASGVMSDSQREALCAYLNRFKLSIGAGLFALPMIFVLIALFGRLTGSFDGQIFLYFGIASGLVALYGLYMAFKQLSVIDADINEGRAEIAEGYVELKTTTGGRTRTVYHLHIGAVPFVVSKAMFEAFHDGERYRVYYTPRAKRLLSAERV
jgi:hypothetical protein